MDETKLNKTYLLLILIAISLQTYLLNGESHSETAIALVVPITINALLFLIYIAHAQEESLYTKGIEKLLTYCVIISGLYFAIFSYGMQLGKAYNH